MLSDYLAAVISFFRTFDRDSAQSTCMLLCLSVWSKLDLVRDSDVKKITELQDVEGKDVKLADGWDKIII